MTLTLEDARKLIRDHGTVPAAALATLKPAELTALRGELVRYLLEDQKRNQIEHYKPVSVDARRIHLATAREVGVQGGNKSGKTGAMLAEVVIQATGVVPRALAADYPAQKLRGREHPIRVRIVVTSLVSAWDTNLKQKLQWFHWNGKLNGHGLPGDPTLGHWGWIPQGWLFRGDWNEAWSEKHRTLTLWHPERKAPWSTIQVMSQDQKIQEFNQGAFDLIVEDELPDEEIHRANRIRAMELGGQIYVGGTPPDDRSSAVTAAWFFDQVIGPGLERSNPDQVDAVVLWTEHNRTLAEADVALVAQGLSDEERRARLHGEAIHLAGLIVKGFTVKPKTWCFRCERPTHAVDERCSACGAAGLVRYSNVWGDEDLEWPGPVDWPVLFYMDPHQARPTACAWYKIGPDDAWWQIAEAELAGDAALVKREVEAFERQHDLQVVWRKADPKITAQGNQFAREVEGERFTIRRAFEDVGFYFDDANTNFTVAIERIERALRPNPYTKRPRLRVHRSCVKTIYHLTHNVWATAKRAENVREQPGKRWSDFVAVTRYMAIDEPEFRTCQMVQHTERVSLVSPQRAGRGATGW